MIGWWAQWGLYVEGYMIKEPMETRISKRLYGSIAHETIQKRGASGEGSESLN